GVARGVLHLHRDGRVDEVVGPAAGRLLREGDPGGRGLPDREVGGAIVGARLVPDGDLSFRAGVSSTVAVGNKVRHLYLHGGIGRGTDDFAGVTVEANPENPREPTAVDGDDSPRRRLRYARGDIGGHGSAQESRERELVLGVVRGGGVVRWFQEG